MDHGTKKPNVGGTYGNKNADGVMAVKAGPSYLQHPGRVTRGPAHNKPRVHLVSSKGKIPAEVVAHALASRPKPTTAGPTTLPNHTPGQTTADVPTQQLKNPSGVAKRPSPAHQNNPALAGRFTPQGLRHAAGKLAP